MKKINFEKFGIGRLNLFILSQQFSEHYSFHSFRWDLMSYFNFLDFIFFLNDNLYF